MYILPANQSAQAPHILLLSAAAAQALLELQLLRELTLLLLVTRLTAVDMVVGGLQRVVQVVRAAAAAVVDLLQAVPRLIRAKATRAAQRHLVIQAASTQAAAGAALTPQARKAALHMVVMAA